MNIESLDIKSLPFVRLSGRPNLPDSPGVYFVADERVTPVYYVGQSESLKRRWMKHDKIRVFEHYDRIDNPVFIYYLEIAGSRAERLDVEARAIGRFVPLMNYQTRGIFKAQETSVVSRLAATPPMEILAGLRDDKDEEYRYIYDPDDQCSDVFVEDLFSSVFDSRTMYVMSNPDDPIVQSRGKELVYLLRGFLDYFQQETAKNSALLCSEITLIAVTVLNKARLELLARADMIERTAADRGVGVGSLTKQCTSNQMFLCVSESISVSLESFGVFSFATGQEKASIETVESPLYNRKGGEKFKVTH